MKMSELRLVGVNNTSDEVVSANIAATMERGYKAFAVRTDGEGPVSIVGAGPSLRTTYRDIIGDVMACNSAHDFLVSKGVIPKYAMLWDAHPIMEKVITPHPGVQYLIASRCHPHLFEKLKGFDVTVWHALGDDGKIEKAVNENGRQHEPLVAGGCTSVLRATHLAVAMGWREMHLFGVDSSYADNETHVIGSAVEQKQIEIIVCGRKFKVAPWMAMQAGDFKLLAPLLMRNGVKLVVHGTGLLPYTATFFPGIDTPDIKVGWYEKARRDACELALLYATLRSPQLLGGSHAGI